jgi:hypothetical protein
MTEQWDICDNQQAWALAVQSGKCSPVVLSESVKRGCPYHFQVKGYKAAPGIVYINFTMPSRELAGDPMHHFRYDGENPHEGLTDQVHNTTSVVAVVSKLDAASI